MRKYFVVQNFLSYIRSYDDYFLTTMRTKINVRPTNSAKNIPTVGNLGVCTTKSVVHRNGVFCKIFRIYKTSIIQNLQKRTHCRKILYDARWICLRAHTLYSIYKPLYSYKIHKFSPELGRTHDAGTTG